MAEKKHHSAVLDNYLQKHRDVNEHTRTKNQRSRRIPLGHDSAKTNADCSFRQVSEKEKSSANKRMPVKLHKLGKQLTLIEFPDELLLRIFEYLSLGDLLTTGRVCKRWKNLTNDNTVSHQQIRKKALQKRKMSRFSGLAEGSEKLLRQAGSKWVLMFCGKHGKELASIYHSDATFFSMSASVRWIDIPPLSFHEISVLRLIAANPVIFDDGGKPVAQSPCRQSLLFEMEFNWDKIKSSLEAIAVDDGSLLNLYSVPGSPLLVATWREGGELAFVTASFHDYCFVERCLYGNSLEAYKMKHQHPICSDIDTRSGLHSYSCAVELRSHKTSLWREQFLNVHSKDGRPVGGYVKLDLINPDRSYERRSLSNAVETLWKTSALKGRIKNLAFLDITLLAEGRFPLFTRSVPVVLTSTEHSQVDYEYNGSLYILEHTDQQGKIVIHFIKEDSTYYIPAFSVFLPACVVNSFFGTSY